MAGEKTLPAEMKTSSPEEIIVEQPTVSTKDIAETPSLVETEPVPASEKAPDITKHGETPTTTEETSPAETEGIPASEEIPTTTEETSPVETEGLPAGKVEVRNVNGIWEHKHDDLDWHVMAIAHKRLNEED